MTIKKVALVLVLAAVVLTLASLVQWEAWDGGFQQAEYRLTFLDEHGRPVKGVQLRVLDIEGNTSWGYPVTDFTEDLIPTSDDKGSMIFHHIGLSPEFGGKCCRLLFMFPIGQCEAPKYALHFILSGRPVVSFEYVDLEIPGRMVDWKNVPIVSRKWEQEGSSSPSLPEHLQIEHRRIPPQLDFYVINKTVTVVRY